MEKIAQHTSGSTADKEKGLCPCLEEEDGVSLEN